MLKLVVCMLIWVIIYDVCSLVGLASKEDMNLEAEQQYIERALNSLKPEYTYERRYLKELELLFSIRSNDSSRITTVYVRLLVLYLVSMNWFHCIQKLPQKK